MTTLEEWQELGRELYSNGRDYERELLKKAFVSLYGSEYSWSELINKAEQIESKQNS